MNIEDLTSAHIGFNVILRHPNGESEFGRLKDWNEKYLFVLWKGDLEAKAVNPEWVEFETGLSDEHAEDARSSANERLLEAVEEARFLIRKKGLDGSYQRLHRVGEIISKCAMSEVSRKMREDKTKTADQLMEDKLIEKTHKWYRQHKGMAEEDLEKYAGIKLDLDEFIEPYMMWVREVVKHIEGEFEFRSVMDGPQFSADGYERLLATSRNLYFTTTIREFVVGLKSEEYRHNSAKAVAEELSAIFYPYKFVYPYWLVVPAGIYTPNSGENLVGFRTRFAGRGEGKG